MLYEKHGGRPSSRQLLKWVPAMASRSPSWTITWVPLPPHCQCRPSTLASFLELPCSLSSKHNFYLQLVKKLRRALVGMATVVNGVPAAPQTALTAGAGLALLNTLKWKFTATLTKLGGGTGGKMQSRVVTVTFPATSITYKGDANQIVGAGCELS
jgi:hypothetical protein